VTSRKDPGPSIATYADHEVITPPHNLRRVVSATSETDGDPVARAEAALAQLSGEFGSWMHAECERLEVTRQNVTRFGLSEKTHAELFRAAHDIKGEAATFGFPALTGVAESLCRLLEHAPELTRIPIPLVDQHVDALRAIAREYSRPDLPEVASALTKRLREVTDEFLKHENSFRPDYLESLFAPPLVPSGAGT
jgi:HPt (histidine-containing phosphotransfer) domain-containing protein